MGMLEIPEARGYETKYVLALPELQQQTLGHDESLEANKHEECFHLEHIQQ